MRAGVYAVVGGVEYRAFTQPPMDVVGLVVPGDRPQPPGFVRDVAADGTGRWLRRVPRASVDRVYEVHTWALYGKGFPVYVAHAHDDGGF